MLTSYRPINFLRRSFQLLNPVLTNSSAAPSGKSALFFLGKEWKFLLFTRRISQLTQEDESPKCGSESFVQMRGLPFEATTADIISFFKPLNVIPVDVIIQRNKWGRPNGLAKAKFKSYDDALIALRNHRNYMGRRYVELSLDVQTKNEGFPQRPLASVSDFPTSEHKVILRGLPYEATAKDVIQFFAPLNIKPVNVEMKYGQLNRPSGICHCVFLSQEEALTALKNHRAFIGRRWIEVFLAPEERPSVNVVN